MDDALCVEFCQHRLGVIGAGVVDHHDREAVGRGVTQHGVERGGVVVGRHQHRDDGVGVRGISA